VRIRGKTEKGIEEKFEVIRSRYSKFNNKYQSTDHFRGYRT
jgi:hypothetical protein